MMKSFNLQEVKEYIANTSSETKIYLGADSERYRKNGIWLAEYTIAVVVHLDGKHGCKIFGYSETEQDFDQYKDKPTLRLMTEVYKVSNLFQDLRDVLEDRQVEVHLDINPSNKYASNQVVQQAIGYIRGTCNVVALIKPNAFAASYAADRLKYLMV